MNFEEALRLHLDTHKSATLQDVVKFSYQAAMGVEHLLKDVDAAKKYFDDEYESVLPAGKENAIPLYEAVSEETVRVNLLPWKMQGYPQEDLFNLFVSTAKMHRADETRLDEYLEKSKDIVIECRPDISYEEVSKFFEEYKKSGRPSVHHSEAFRLFEKPAYRIVSFKLLSEYLRTV